MRLVLRVLFGGVGGATAAALCLLASAAAAQSPAHLEKAKLLLAITAGDAQIIEALDLSLRQIEPRLREHHPDLTGPKFENYISYVKADILEHLGPFKAAMARIYARAFTAEELDQMIAFYTTPVGQKALTELPRVLEQMAFPLAEMSERITERALRRALGQIDPAPKGDGDL